MCPGDEKYGDSLTATGMRTLALTPRTMSTYPRSTSAPLTARSTGIE
jgi:hypothetical protein